MTSPKDISARDEAIEACARIVDEKIAKVIAANTYRGKVNQVVQNGISLLEDCAKSIRASKTNSENQS